MGRIMIAGTNSGCGKTTVTTALLSAFKARGIRLSAFKCGPDYIDPMFHRQAIGVASRNLDAYFCSEDMLRAQLSAAGGELAVIEGVMGYYDGIGTEGTASSYHIAKATQTPVILVVNARGIYTSAGALIKGFCSFRPQSNIKGVIFNGASPMTYEGLKQIAIDAGVVPLGFLPKSDELAVGSRHLGLITADEIEDIQQKICRLGELAEQYIDLDKIIALADEAVKLPCVPKETRPIASVRIAVARDRAFCFVYQENLDMLEKLGCELCFFSPMNDDKLPEGVSGLYLPGGYPELYAEQLSANRPMLAAVKKAIEGDMSTIAECGGFLYLHRELDGVPMADVIPAQAYKTEKLQRFGYVKLTANSDNLLCKKGESIRCHEFHYYDSTDCGNGFTAQKPSGKREYLCVHISKSLYAGFLHLYFPANPAFAENFVRSAAHYADK